MKRILSWVLALSLLISVLPLNVFAAEPGTEVLPAANAKTQLSVSAAMYSYDTADWWADFEADFEAAHSDVDLVVDICDWGTIYADVAERIDQGNAPDILNIDGYENYQHMLLPVSGYMSQETYSKFYPEFLAQSEMDGQVWAVPDLASARALYYNVDLLEGAGVEVPTTFAELEEACAALKKTYGDKILPWGLDVSDNEGFAAFAMYTWAAGGGFLDDQGYWAVNSDANKEIMHYAVDLYEQGYANGPDLTRYDLLDQFINGQIAMTIAPDSYRFQLDYVGLNYGVANLVGNGMNPSHSIGVMDRFMCFDNGYSEAELAAVTAFFDFFYEDARYAQWARMEGFLPATSGGMAYLAETDPDMAVWGDILENARFYPTNKAEWWNVRTGVVDVLKRSMLEGADPGQLLDELQAQLPSAPNPNADLTVWAASNEVAWIRNALAAFQKANPQWADLVFDIGVVPAGDSYTQINNDPDNAADVYAFANDQLNMLRQAGYIAPMNQDTAAWVAGDYSRMVLNSVSGTDGKLYGVPYTPNTWFLYYNKNIFSEEDVTSLETMLSKGKVAFAVGNSWYLPAFYFANGGTLFGENGMDAAAGVQFGGNRGAEVTRYLVQMMENDNFVVDGDGRGNAGLKDGSIGAYFSGSWDYAGLYEILGDSLGAAPAPTVNIGGEDKQLKPYAGTKAFGVNPNSDYPEVAQALAAFLGSAESQLLAFDMGASMPIHPSLAEEEPVASDVVAAAQLKTMEIAALQPTVFEMSYVWGPMGQLGYDIAEGYVTLENSAEKTAMLNINANGLYFDGVSAAGTCGEFLNWAIDFNDQIRIFGTGAMDNYAPDQELNTAPWADYTVSTVVLDSGVTTVGAHAFRFTNATYLTLPDTLVSIGDGAFDITPLSALVLPEGVETIGNGAFSGTNLRTLEFPASIKVIGSGAFSGCDQVNYIGFLGDAPSIGNYAFNKVTSDVYYPGNNATWTADVMQNYGGTLTWVPYYEEVVEIASGWSGYTQWTLTSDGVLTVYGSGNMKNYGYDYTKQPWAGYADMIKSLVIEEGVTAIGTGAFMNLTKLETVTLPDAELNKIGEAAFYGCTSLKAIDIPDTVYTVFDYTFKNCTSLADVRLSKVLIKIGQGAFESCTALDYVYIPGNTGIIGSWSFKGCTALTEVDMTWADANEIREGAFKNCCALTTIRLPSDIRILGDSCFYGIGATSFTIPATVTEVGPWCFARAYTLTRLTFKGNAPTIGEGAFNKITLTVLYPKGNTTWTASIMQNYGGTVTWKAN